MILSEDEILSFPQRERTQESAFDQLADLEQIARRIGFVEAADFLRRTMDLVINRLGGKQ
jgi:hypothetical protein